MINLIPTEFHGYSLLDVFRGLTAPLKRIGSLKSIRLPELGDGIPIRSARTAVIVALKALGIPPGSRIGVPLYCCPVIFKAIKAASCVPLFLDIDPETFCLSSEDLRMKYVGIDAVIAVHMFGNICDMPKIIDIMNGKPVIEDCAQSIGSKLNGKACWSFGDVSFFSFRSGKYLSTGEGGALFSKNADLLSSLSNLTSALPIPSRSEEVKHVVTTYIRSSLRSRRLWGLLGTKIWAAYNKKTDFVDKSPIILGRIFASNLETIRRRMPYLDSMIAMQRKHAEYYEQNLILNPHMIYKEPPGFYLNRFMYPIIFPSTNLRDRTASYLKSHGVDSSRPYEGAIADVKKHYGYRGECPVAEKLLRRTIVIPSYWALSFSEVEYIAKCINDAWGSSLA